MSDLTHINCETYDFIETVHCSYDCTKLIVDGMWSPSEVFTLVRGAFGHIDRDYVDFNFLNVYYDNLRLKSEVA